MAEVTWSVTGKLSVEMHESKNLEAGTVFDVTAGLAGAEVKVEGSSLNSGGISTWGTVRTDIQGRFTWSGPKPNAGRRIRVSARFRDDLLKVTAPSPLSDWSVVCETDGKVSASEVPTVNYTFRRINDKEADNHYKRAATWYLCKKVMEELTNHDSWFAFKDRVNIVYPAKAVNGSYANGMTRTVYINYVFAVDDPPDNGDQWDVPTVLHELMHIWNYDHNSGTTNWFGAILWDASTHGFQEREAVAFHEGFCTYAKDEFLHHIWGHAKVRPSSRAGLRGTDWEKVDKRKEPVYVPLDDLPMVERNEDGVLAALHLLTTPKIYTWVFGTKDSSPDMSDPYHADTVTGRRGRCPKAPSIDFWDVLSIFKPNAEAGWPEAWDARQTNGIFQFYERASDFFPDFDDETREMYVALLNRESTVEPHDRCIKALTLPN